MEYYLQGLTVGLAYVAPIGLQNLFVINSAVSLPRSRTFILTLFVILFDVILALACFWGIGAVLQHYRWLQLAVLLIGGLIVIYIGIGLLRAKPAHIQESAENRPLRSMIMTACVVTWFNPQAIIDGTMMLGAFYVTLPADQSYAFISGVTSASALWFIGLTLIVSSFKKAINQKVLRIINIICGAVITFYGLNLLYHFIQSF